MTIATCPRCGAALAPAEVPTCFTCAEEPATSVGDRAVKILEQSSVPLSHWDIRRLMDRTAPTPARTGALLVYLSQDRRVCWAGKGIYGLFRHGLAPAVVGLGPVAEVHLLASRVRLDLDQLHFVLRHQGYRYQPASLAAALDRHIGYDWSHELAPRGSDYDQIRREQRSAQLLGFRRRSPTFAGYYAAIARRVERALHERLRRLR